MSPLCAQHCRACEKQFRGEASRWAACAVDLGECPHAAAVRAGALAPRLCGSVGADLPRPPTKWAAAHERTRHAASGLKRQPSDPSNGGFQTKPPMARGMAALPLARGGAQLWGQTAHKGRFVHTKAAIWQVVPETGAATTGCHTQGCHSHK
jgi:hypothetical protein